MEKFWADQIVEEILKVKKANFNIATGITPSGPIHIGNMREVITADIIFKILQAKRHQPTLFYIADDLDPLRKLYPFLPKEFEKYIGMPLCNIPCPCAKHENYAQHFLKPFFASVKALDIPLQTYYSSKLYKDGKMTDVIEEALKNTTKIVDILSKVTGRKMPAGWSPYNPICDKCGKIAGTKVLNFDLDQKLVFYECSCGHKGQANFAKGEGKLSWRVDWPARWKVLDIKIEPMGKDHAAAGGSWDSGEILSKEIFHFPTPYPIFFEWVHLKGKGAMSSSQNIAFEAAEMLKVASPEILRYLFVRSKPSRHIDFDPKDGLPNLIEEYASLQKKAKTTVEKRAMQLSQISQQAAPILPLNHLTTVIQASAGNFAEIKRLLKQSGHQEIIKNETVLKEQIARANYWLENYADEKMKFVIQKTVPQNIKFGKGQQELLKKIADYLKKQKIESDKLHNFIYETGKQLGLSPKETFQPFYQAILAKDSGPKLGWFLALLPKDFVLKRLQEVSR